MKCYFIHNHSQYNPSLLTGSQTTNEFLLLKTTEAITPAKYKTSKTNKKVTNPKI